MRRWKMSESSIFNFDDHRKLRPRISESTVHQQFVLPVVERLLDEGFSLIEIAEILRAVADILGDSRRGAP